MRIIIITLCILLSITTCFAQDIFLSHYKNTRLFQNPANCGLNDYPEINVDHRNQWPSISGSFLFTFIEVDISIKKINSGLGIYAYSYMPGEGCFSNSNFGLNYSPNFKLGGDLLVKPGIGIGVNYLDVDFPCYNIQQALQINLTNNLWTHYNNISIDASLGLLLKYKNLHISSSVSHVNEAEFLHKSDYIGYNKPKLNIYASYAFLVTDNFAILPSTQFIKQKSYTFFIQKVGIKRRNVIAELAYAHNNFATETIYLSAGYNFKRIGFLYTLEIQISEVRFGTLSTHTAGIYFRPFIKNKTIDNIGLGLF